LAKLKNNNKLQAGFTLVETIFVIGVLTILLTGTFTIIRNLISLNKKIALRSVAYRTMDTKLEELRYQNFNDIAASDTASAELPTGNHVIVTVSNNVDGQAQTGIKKVDVTINWNFKGPESVATSTYITQGGIKK